jgi:outer membrane protein OmpA-like peptidoglycan-associated protein
MATRPPSLLESEEPPEPEPDRSSRLDVVILLLLIASIAALGYVGYRVLKRTEALERQVALLSSRADQAAALAQQASKMAATADANAHAAAEGRELAELEAAGAKQETAVAKQETEVARQEATVARQTAAQAQAEAERIRKKAEADTNRLETALGQIAETRRTALGLVMNLSGDHLKFEFNKAELRPQDRELLARIAGILMTAHDYTVSVNGHTDDVGSAAYNQKLSERRAQAVRDYLAQAGMPPEMLTDVVGHGKSRPLVKGRTEAARAKNRRVELGIVNTQIRYGQ